MSMRSTVAEARAGERADARLAMPTASVTALAVLAVLLSSIPLLVVSVPPLGDYISHLAGAALLDQLRHGGFAAEHYAIGSPVVPDVLYDVVVGGLGLVLPLGVASKLFLVLTFSLLMGGTILLHRAIHGRVSYWPLVAALFLYNWIFLFGFMSYVAGIGLMLVMLACWLRAADRPWPWRLLLGLVFATIIFFCHLIVLALYAAAVAGLEIDRALRERELREAGGRLVVGAAPFAAPAALYLLTSPTRGVAEGHVTFDVVQKLLSPLVTLTSGVRSGDLLTLVVLAVAIALGLFASRARLPRGPALALLLMAAIFAAAPDEIVPAAYIDSRIPLALLFFAIAALDVRPRRPGAARLVGVVLAALFLVRVGLITWQWAGFASQVRTYETLFALVPDDATLIAMREIGSAGGDGGAGSDGVAGPDPLAARVNSRLRSMLVTNAYEPRLELPVHITALAAVRRPIFVPQIFATPGIQLIGLKPAFAPIKDVQGNGPVEVATAEQFADVIAEFRAAVARTPAAAAPLYLMLQHRADLAPLPLPDGVGLVREARTVSLLKIDMKAHAPS